MPDSRRGPLAAEVAEILAIQALGFIARDGERLGRFLALTGLGPSEIRVASRDRHFLAGVLEYVSGDEQLLVEFAKHAGVDPASVGNAQRALSQASGDTGAA